MECNRVCSLCNSSPADKFCICSNLPLLCTSCRPTHETKSGFHFALPMAGFEFVNPQNQAKYKMWLVCLETSHEKLRENLLQIDKCREEIEGAYTHIQAELKKAKGQLLQTLEDVKGILSTQIDAAIKETSANAYLWNYQFGSHLAFLVWTHSSQQSSEPIPAFTYQVKADMESLQDLLSVSFRTSIPEISRLNAQSHSMDLKQEIANLQTKLAQEIQKETGLMAHCKELEAQIHTLKSQLEAAEAPPLNKREPAESEETRKTEKRKPDPSKDEEIVKKHAKHDNPKPKPDVFKIIRPTKQKNSIVQQFLEAPSSAAPPITQSTLPSICKICKQPFTYKDKDWQCAKLCNCKRCTISLIVSGLDSRCKGCNVLYRKRLKDNVYNKWWCCGSCGVNYRKKKTIAHLCEDICESDEEEFTDRMWDEAMINDSRCPACFTVNPFGDNIIECSVCAEEFTVTSEEFELVKEMPKVLKTRGCCAFKIAKIPYKKLKCGHLVCCRHVDSLFKCRVCHEIADIEEE